MTRSWWNRAEPRRRVADLPPDGACDVAIVGAGFAGLSTAWHLALARPGARIVVLESEHVGYGASGRAGGVWLPFPAVPAWLVAGSLPERERLAAMSTISRDLRELAEVFAATGAPVHKSELVIGTSSRLLARTFPWLARHAQEHGAAANVWTARELGERGCGSGAAGFVVDAYRVHPFALAQHLADEIESLAVRIVEGCAVTKIDAERDGVYVRTARGSVRTTAAVLCTNAYAPALSPSSPQSKRVMHSYMCATAELPDSVIETLGGRHRLISSIDPSGLVYRRIEDRRLLFGALDVPRLPPTEASAQKDEPRRRLRALLARTLPQVAAFPIEYEWGGPFVRNGAEIPTIARDPRDPRIVVNVGYGGGGIALSLYSGKLIRGLIDPDLEDPADARMREAFARTRIRGTGLLRTGLAALVQRPG